MVLLLLPFEVAFEFMDDSLEVWKLNAYENTVLKSICQ